MLNYARLSKKPSLFRSFTGLEVAEFDAIYREIASRYEKYERKRLSRRKRRERDDAVRTGLYVKRAPTILRSFSRLKNKAQELGIDCDGHKNGDYYLNLYLARAQHHLPDQISFNKAKQKARKLFHSLDGNIESRARKAVELAIGRKGIWKN